jgi:hypothetical protein
LDETIAAGCNSSNLKLKLDWDNVGTFTCYSPHTQRQGPCLKEFIANYYPHCQNWQCTKAQWNVIFKSIKTLDSFKKILFLFKHANAVFCIVRLSLVQIHHAVRVETHLSGQARSSASASNLGVFVFYSLRSRGRADLKVALGLAVVCKLGRIHVLPSPANVCFRRQSSSVTNCLK